MMRISKEDERFVKPDRVVELVCSNRSYEGLFKGMVKLENNPCWMLQTSAGTCYVLYDSIEAVILR